MIARISRSVALIGCLALAMPVYAQTTGATGTGTTGAASAAMGGAGSSRVTSSGGGGGGMGSGSGFGNTGGSSAAGPFQGTVPASFSGSAGTSTATNSTGSAGRGISGAIAVPTTNNPWLSTYGNPYAIGQSVLGSGSTAKAAGVNKGFGQPLFSTSITGIGTTAGLQNRANSASGFNNANISKTPRYTSALSEDIPFVNHPPVVLQARLQEILARSTSIRGERIQVVVDGSTVVLLGQAGSERERRLAESMLRLSPGVSDVENRLTLPDEQ